MCHVKAQSKSKGSNLATVCRSELAVAVGMVSGVVKWMDVMARRWDTAETSTDIDLTMTTGLRTGMKNRVAILAGVVWHQYANLAFS